MPPPKPKIVTSTPVLPRLRLDKGSMVLHPVDCDQRIPGRHQPLLLAFGARSDVDAVDATNLGPEHRHVVLRTTNREGCSVGIPDRVGERVDEPGAVGHRPEIAHGPPVRNGSTIFAAGEASETDLVTETWPVELLTSA